jgi:transposase-like protein
MPNTTERIEVLSSIQRRRRYSLDEKIAVLTEAAQPGMSISYVEILREALKIAQEKKLISHLPSLPDGDTP